MPKVIIGKHDDSEIKDYERRDSNGNNPELPERVTIHVVEKLKAD
jgi:hypothetical protein